MTTMVDRFAAPAGRPEPPATGMRVRVDPSLAERAVWRAIRGGQAPRGALAEHRRRAEAAYGVEDPGAREAAFERAAQAEFEVLGLAGPLWTAVAERPELAARVRLLLIGEARGRADEGITCDPEAEHVGFRVEARRFDDPAGLLGWARHAVGHARDTLDPDFHYERDWQDRRRVSGAAEGRVHRLWDISVDARLAAEGLLDPAPARRRHEAVIAADLPGVGAEALAAAFASLWDGPRPSFPELLAFAAEPADLVRLTAPGAPDVPRPDRCPLCHFPSDDVVPPEPWLAESVQREYPAWRPADGLCGRCADRSRFIARPGGGR